MIEPKPEYVERLKREKICNEFLADIQSVLNKWHAEMEGDDARHICFTVYSPLHGGEYDPEKPMVDFSESYLYPVPTPNEDRPGEPINWGHATLESFVDNNYWHNPEDAIGDIRLYITKHKM